ncbi:uncharacterized protein LKV04_015153 [Tautogolabrus adspersus]
MSSLFYRSNSSRYDYITSKRLICSGPPAVYQLQPKKENIGTLTKMTIGEKDPKTMNKTILLVGETKTGKSTLINTLVNYAMGVKWEDEVWFSVVENYEEESEASQTSDVIVYEIFGFEDKPLPYSLTIIDTPGYGDIRGTEHDDFISQRLFDLFRSEDGVHEINVVGLVLKASENRLNDQLRYIFDSAVSLFGKDMENNIVALLTHSCGVSPENALTALKAANIKCAKDAENDPRHFLFNNCQHEDRTEDTEALKQANKITTKGMSQFFDFLEQTEPQKLETTVNVLNERNRLTACIQNLQERVQLIELQQTEIQQSQEALRKHEQEMKSNQNFTVEVDEPYKVKKPISGGRWALVFYEGAVCCKVCEENCHYPGCTMAWYPAHCEVMSKGRCTSCKGKCPVTDHEKKQEIYEIKTKKVSMTLQDVKDKYESRKPDFEKVKNTSEVRKEKCDGSEEDHQKAEHFFESLKKSKADLEDRKEKYERIQKDCEETTSLLEGLKRKMEKLEEDKDQCLEESYEHVLKLEQIALNVDSLSTLVHLDFLIEKMKENRDSPEKDRFREKVQKLEEIKSRVDEGTRAGLRYMLGQVKASMNLNSK